MGLFKMSSSTLDVDRVLDSKSKLERIRQIIQDDNEITPPNPDPRKYKIISYLCVKNHLIVELKYKGCTNFEGRKLLLFKNLTLKELKDQGIIDPHFSNSSKFHHPIARFEPNKEGWFLAESCAEVME